MPSATRVFQAISYLQYPAVLLAVVYVVSATREEGPDRFEALNTGLVFMGLSVSLSTLQDTTTTQNEISRRVWSHPVAGRSFLGALALMTVAFIAVGLVGMHRAADDRLHQLSFGLMVLGIGMIGLLKVAGEMFEHHRSDRVD